MTDFSARAQLATQISVVDHSRFDSHRTIVNDGFSPSDDHRTAVSQHTYVVAGSNSVELHATGDSHNTSELDGSNSVVDHIAVDSQSGSVGNGSNFAASHGTPDGHPTTGRSESNPVEVHAKGDSHAYTSFGGFLRDPLLTIAAEILDDVEGVRIANSNRYLALTRTEVNENGDPKGYGLSDDHIAVAKTAALVEQMKKLEHEATLNLQRAMRGHPLIEFQKKHKGLGEKQMARLLAAIGDPYWHDFDGRPRTVRELWAYCGLHVTGDGTAPRRRRGHQSNWSETARKRIWVIASAMPKFPGSHYETIYREARVKYADAEHATMCIRCGPSGKPAQPGSPLSDGHKHARAVRYVAKTILKDIWIASRDIYEKEAEKQT
jgi:hypothetical protein